MSERAAIPEQKTAVATHGSDHEYDSLRTSCRETFARIGAGRLFQTDANGLWELYLKNLPAQERQFHTCYCCRRFVETYGALVAIDEGGHTTPAMWSPDVSGMYGASSSSMFHAVESARVTSAFFSKETVWGTPVTGDWTHLSVAPPAALVHRERSLTAGQKMAAKKQDFITVSAALSEFTRPMLDQALRLLLADALARSEKFIGPAKWLRALHDRPNGRLGENVLWAAIASAPDGYCHPKSSVIGPLLADIAAGLPFDDVKPKFEAMLHPLRYQRPQAAPAAGNIRAAEAIVEKLGVARSLERRFARLDEVPKAWEPRAVEAKPAGRGIFAHLEPKQGAGAIKPIDLPESVVTAEKFVAKVLPMAEAMQFLVPAHGNFIGMLTAEHADAPVIHKWGNPFSIYVYHGGSAAVQWKIEPSRWTTVSALVRVPCMWGDRPMPHLGDGYIIALEGAVDTRENFGNALFPETLIGELFGARATVEAYSKTAKVGGRETASVCGYSLGKAADHQIKLRVFSNGAWTPYRIDRWD